MLRHLQLQHIAIADQIDMDLSEGLTVMTGETGAGKSLLINAIKLLSGERAQANIVKAGHDKGSISANFDVSQLDEAKAWLQSHDFYEDDNCHVRRILTKDGPSKAYINGHACTLNDLKALSKHLVGVHGQHEGQRLLQEKYQQALLDTYGQALPLLHATENTYTEWKNLQKEHADLLAKSEAGEKQLEFLRFQYEELKDLELDPAHIESLDESQKLLANADSLLSEGNAVYDALQGEAGACEQLSTAIAHLQKLKITQRDSLVENLNQALIQAEECARDIEHLLNDFDNDPERLSNIENELGKIHDLARKHRVTPTELLTLRDNIEQSIDAIDHSDERLKKLSALIQTAEKQYLDKAKKLSAARQKAAKILSETITASIRTLGMPKGQFIVALSPLDKPASTGLEKVRFDVNLNPGQQPGPLNKIASGGELSRISLAIHVATAQDAQTPTLVFDEVDTGISGDVANVVGELLSTLSNNAQILCITHLAQVAAKGRQHFQVSKTATDDETTSAIIQLTHEDRIQELAFMTSGKRDDQHARALAEKLLA